jgi:hypothetical protein
MKQENEEILGGTDQKHDECHDVISSDGVKKMF